MLLDMNALPVSRTQFTLDGLDVRHLRALVAVVDQGTFARAGIELGFTQSAVSQQIASLERLVGERLFDRPGGPRPVTLTSAGRLVLRHAKRILDLVAGFERDVAGHKAGQIGRIDVALFQSISVKVLPAVVGRLRRETEADVRPYENNDDHLTVAQVASGDSDVGFVATQVQVPPHITYVEVASDPFVVVAARAYSDDQVFDARALAEVPLIGQPVSDTCQIRVDAGLLDMGVKPDYVFRTSDNAALQSMVREGMGLAVMPLLAVDPNDPAITVSRIKPELSPRTIGLIFSNEPSPLVQRFVELAIDVCREAVASMSSASKLT